MDDGSSDKLGDDENVELLEGWSRKRELFAISSESVVFDLTLSDECMRCFKFF